MWADLPCCLVLTGLGHWEPRKEIRGRRKKEVRMLSPPALGHPTQPQLLLGGVLPLRFLSALALGTVSSLVPLGAPLSLVSSPN